MDTRQPEEAPSDPPAPDVEGDVEDGVAVEEVTSPSDIEDTPLAQRPADIILMIPGQTKPKRLRVECQYPKESDGSPMELWSFQTQYLSLSEVSATPKVDKAGKVSYPNEGCHEEFLREKIIVSPTWLKSSVGYEKFRRKVPPTVTAKLHQGLRFAIGMDADFFAEWGAFITPRALRLHTAASGNASGSSPTKSPTTTPPTPTAVPESPPSTPGAATEPEKSVLNA